MWKSVLKFYCIQPTSGTAVYKKVIFLKIESAIKLSTYFKFEPHSKNAGTIVKNIF